MYYQLFQVYLVEGDGEPDTLIENYKDPFTRLMDFTSEPIEFLNEFSYKLEQENSIDLEEKDRQNQTPYYRISHKIRRSIKDRKNFPMCLIKGIEGNVIDFFKIKPQDIFCCVPSKSFERLLFHAVAQYHGLSSVSLVKDGHISVEVCNLKDEWLPELVMLSDYIVDKNIIN